MTPAQLRAEWDQWLGRANQPHVKLRLFWKHVPDFTFAGGNNALVADSGLPSVEHLVGRTDFDPIFPWSRQAAWYRRHDEEVVRSRTPQLDILERQDQALDTVWLHTSKTVMLGEKDDVVGLMGVYEVLDHATGARLFKERQLRQK